MRFFSAIIFVTGAIMLHWSVHVACMDYFSRQYQKKKKQTTQGKTSALLLGDTFCGRHLRFIIITKINHSKLEHSYDIPSTQTFSGGEGGHGNCLSQSCDSWTRETIFGCLAMFQFLSSGISILLH